MQYRKVLATAGWWVLEGLVGAAIGLAIVITFLR